VRNHPPDSAISAHDVMILYPFYLAIQSPPPKNMPHAAFDHELHDGARNIQAETNAEKDQNNREGSTDTTELMHLAESRP
jgi:hypothetical protein